METTLANTIISQNQTIISQQATLLQHLVKIVWQNKVIIAKLKENDLDINAVNAAVAALSAGVDNLASDMSNAGSAAQTKVDNLQAALDKATSDLNTLAAQDGQDQALIASLRESLDKAQAVDFTDTVNSINSVSDKITTLDVGLKAAATQPAPADPQVPAAPAAPEGNPPVVPQPNPAPTPL